MQFEYDAFISHANEDKQDVAEPLTKMLEDLGVRVWYDTIKLRHGDSLLQEIQNGLIILRFDILNLAQTSLIRKYFT